MTTDSPRLDFVTGTGQVLVGVHKESAECQQLGCVIHWPSSHHMREWPTHWRGDRKLMERLCPHGVGHPDPDHLSYVARVMDEEIAAIEGLHGCCQLR